MQRQISLTSADKQKNEQLIRFLREKGALTTREVENALRMAPRSLFCPEELKSVAYEDRPIANSLIHLSAPHMYAYMLEACELKAGLSFLDIGSGSGWFTALAGVLVGEQGMAYGIDIVADIVNFSRSSIEMARNSLSLKLPQTEFFVENVFFLHSESQKYDRINCGADCPTNKVPHLISLLKEGGILVVPSQGKLLKIQKLPSGVTQEVLLSVIFKNMIVPSESEIAQKKQEQAALRSTLCSIIKPNPDKSILEMIRAPATSPTDIKKKTEMAQVLFTSTSKDGQTKMLLTEMKRQLEALEQELKSIKSSPQSARSSKDSLDDLEINGDVLHIGDKISQGGEAKVYKGFYLGTPVAIKKLRACHEEKHDLKSEALLLRKMRHPNIVMLLGICYHDRRLCIVTELLKNGSLYNILHDRKTPLTLKTKLKIAFQLALGMNYIHNTGGVHRDLKSQNVLLDDDLNAKIADFGISRLITKTMLSQAPTMNIGTPIYSAPEVFSGLSKDSKILTKMDVYSYGILLWELFSSTLPYPNSTSIWELVGKIMNGTRPSPLPSSAPPELNHLMSKCWQHDPSSRPSFHDIMPITSKLAEAANQMKIEKEDSDLKMCKICMDKELDCVILNCGHMICCLPCGKTLKDCPNCRQPIARLQKVYLS